MSLTSSTERKPWEKRDSETSRAFGAFKMYRDLGALRTMPKVVEALGKGPGYLRTLEGWSQKHQWTMRVNAYDLWRDQMELQAEIDLQTRARQLRRKALNKVLAVALKGLEEVEEIAWRERVAAIKMAVRELRAEYDETPTTRIENDVDFRASGGVQIYIPDNNRGREPDEQGD